jgi:exodeoxyribonuclease VII large subunit
MTAKIPAGVRILRVSDLTNRVKCMLEDEFAAVWVSGQVSGFKKHQSGHWYFKLSDRGAVINAVMYRGSNLRSRFDPRDGMEVIARGRLTIYPPQGNYQLAVEEMHAKGLGAQELALQRLKEKLFRKGYFAPARKRRLPRYPRCLALITSPSGAAVRDMLEILGRRWPATEVWICPVRVQGDTAAFEIATALGRLNRFRCVDVVILGRGGGSTEDLGPFNDERVADAIFRSRIPVVSAVGHEIDVTIADQVADVRALTPSEAAELVVPDRAELIKKLRDTHLRLGRLLRERLDFARGRLKSLAERRVFRRPLDRVHDLEQRLDQIDDRLQRATRQRLSRLRQLLQAAAGRLESLSPLQVLGRGYTLTRRADDQQVVRSFGQVKPGDLVETIVQDGQFASRVEKIERRE